MGKSELRNQLLIESLVGDVELELRQMQELQERTADVYTWSATCSEILTLICC